MAFALLATGTACSAKRKASQTAEVLTAEATLKQVDDAMARHQLRKAKTLLGKIQFTQEERPKYEPLVRLALADATYYLGDDLSLIEARSKYLDFVTLYSDHPKAPYAQFQAGMCSVKQIYSASRDQAQTQVAIADFHEIDKRWSRSALRPRRAAVHRKGPGRPRRARVPRRPLLLEEEGVPGGDREVHGAPREVPRVPTEGQGLLLARAHAHGRADARTKGASGSIRC